MGEIYKDKRKEIKDRTRKLLEELVNLSRDYCRYEVPIVNGARPRCAIRSPSTRRKMRKKMMEIVLELGQQKYSMSLDELGLFTNRVGILASDRTIKAAEIADFFANQKQEALALKEERLANVDAFYLVDRLSKKDPVVVLPTMEATIDHMARVCGGKVELLSALQRNRFMVVAGKKAPIHHEVKDVELEVELEL